MKDLLKLSTITLSILVVTSVSTRSFFADNEVSYDNCFVLENTSPSPLPPVSDILITEVFYNPDGSYYKNERKREWLEIYNTTANAINLQNWKIQDNSSTLILPNISLPANSYGVIVRYDNDTLPGGVLKIPPNNPYWFNYDYLKDSGDRVYLKNPDNTIIDSISYGSDTTVFNPACIPTAINHSFERTTLTVDTDTAADWIDNPNPSPGLPYLP